MHRAPGVKNANTAQTTIASGDDAWLSILEQTIGTQVKDRVAYLKKLPGNYKKLLLKMAAANYDIDLVEDLISLEDVSSDINFMAGILETLCLSPNENTENPNYIQTVTMFMMSILKTKSDLKLMDISFSYALEYDNQVLCDLIITTVLEKGDKKYWKWLETAMGDYYKPEVFLESSEVRYKLIIKAISEDNWNFIKILDKLNFNIISNLIENESDNSKLIGLLGKLLDSKVLYRHSKTYGIDYVNLLTNDDISNKLKNQLIKLFLHNNLPLSTPFSKSKKMCKKCQKLDPEQGWLWNTYILIGKVRSDEDRHIAMEIVSKMSDSTKNLMFQLSDYDIKIRIIYDTACLANVSSTIFFLKEFYKSFFEQELDNSAQDIIQAFKRSLEDQTEEIKESRVSVVPRLLIDTVTSLFRNHIKNVGKVSEDFFKILENVLKSIINISGMKFNARAS